MILGLGTWDFGLQNLVRRFKFRNLAFPQFRNSPYGP
jgi:hypothetical protein